MKSGWLARLSGLASRPAIGEQSLEIGTDTFDLQSDLTAETRGQDGLGLLAPDAGTMDDVEPCLSPVAEIDLVNRTAVHDLVFPDTWRARVLVQRLLTSPHVRFFTAPIQPGRIRSVGNLATVPVSDGNRWLLAMPSIQSRSLPLAALPHRRTSIRIETLQDAERREFLHQAQLSKRMRAEDGEVVAVFRHVPIEMITSLRYAINEDMIVYSIADSPGRSRTRVHDMAAVRDNTTGEVYLIPRQTHVNVELGTNG